MNLIPFAQPDIGDEEIAAVTTVLRSGWLTTGAEALAFENEFASYVGCAHGLAVNSATAGLHLALEAVGVGPGDTVIVPSLTFTATAEVAHYLRAKVMFCDICRDTLLLDPGALERCCASVLRDGGSIGAIIPVHLMGAVCPMAEILEIATRYDTVVIEDAAHAFPVATDSGYVGTLGTVGVFSFYANKTITTGEGGMVCTNRDDIAARIRTMRLHGIDRESWFRFRTPGSSSWQYDIVAPGYKYNMPDTAAALGRVQLRRAVELLEKRRAIVQWYYRRLSQLAHDGLIKLPHRVEEHAWHLFVVRVLRHDRDAVIAALGERGIGTSVHYIPLHHTTFWSATAQPTDLPGTEEVAPQILSLPLFPKLTEADVARVVDALAAVFDELEPRP